MSSLDDKTIESLAAPIREDLLSGAAELTLRAITIYQSILAECEADMESCSEEKLSLVKQNLERLAVALVDAQPAMATIFHLSNSVLKAAGNASNARELVDNCREQMDSVEKNLCESASLIADNVFELIDYGSLVFAYSFSSTVVSALLSARSRGKYFRVVCTESRPSMEGRKLASALASGGIEVIHTFDSAMGLILPSCSAAFMGCDCVAGPGVVNKVGSWMLAIACRELKVPLYALAGTEKFVGDERLFEFEKHERPGSEVWESAPKGVRLLNHQFELVPFNLFSGLVTERGILDEPQIESYMAGAPYEVHEALKLVPLLTVSE